MLLSSILLRTAADIPVCSAEKRENPLLGLGRIWQQTETSNNILAKLQKRNWKFGCKIFSLISNIWFNFPAKNK